MTQGDRHDEIAAAYSRSAPAWADGPARVYRRLARDLVAAAPAAVRGALVLDVGAGTGEVSEAVVAAGGRCIALDVAWRMLTVDRHHRPPAVAGDASRLPLRAASVDAVVTACTLSHVPDPVRALGEAERVLRPGGFVLASAFPPGGAHPAKAAVEDALAAFGYEPPGWYRRLKQQGEPATGDPDALLRLAGAAGLGDAAVSCRSVAVDLETPEAFVDWRLGMASAAPFVAQLAPADQAALREAAIQAVGPQPPPLVVDQLVLAARASS